MNRTAWLQERRMEKSQDMLGRFELKRLSAMDVAELLGMSERSFRRYRHRFWGGRSGGAVRSPARQGLGAADSGGPDCVDARGVSLSLCGVDGEALPRHLRDRHGFTLSYTWTKIDLQPACLVAKEPRCGAHRRRRPRKPCTGMMLHQDGSHHAWQCGQMPLDLNVLIPKACHEYARRDAGGHSNAVSVG